MTPDEWHGLSFAAELPVDDKPVENEILPIAHGRNWRFTDFEPAGRRVAVIQSLLRTAKLSGLDPNAWPKDTLDKMPAWPFSRIDDLLALWRLQDQ